jgi:tetratricopeptide (TPR) repeat protein
VVAPGVAAAEPPLPGVPGYELEGVLGRGNMGVVYKARHLALKRTVALKMVLAAGHAGPEDRVRFRLEAEAVARLQHPNIVQIYEVGESDGHPYCALEFVDGGSLAARLAGRPLPAREAARLVEALARAVQLAHSRNVVHRDLKPANVLLAADGTPKVADFGLARHLDSDSGQTQTGVVMGTPSYMAPEQASGRSHEAGPPADVYALGAILYQCLAGRPPFKAATLLDTLDQVRTQEPVPPSRCQAGVPLDLETICLKCLRKEPENRYPSAAELADELARYQRGEPIRARPVGRRERAVKWVKRNPTVAALVAVSGSLLVLGLVVTAALAVLANRRAERIAAINEELVTATKESELRGEIALQTLEAVIQDIQTELTNLPNAQKLRGRLLGKAMDAMNRLDDKLRTQRRADRGTALALLSMAEVFRQVGNETGPKGPATANKLYERAIALFETLAAETPTQSAPKGELAEAYLLHAINLARTDDTGWEVTAASSAERNKQAPMQRGLALHRQATDLRRQLLAEKPDDSAARRELARALSEWAYLEVRAGDAETARQVLEEAYLLLKQLLTAEPGHVANRTLFAKCAERLGDWYFDIKHDYVRCEPYVQESLTTMTQLAAEQPRDPGIQMDWANSWSRMADLHRARKDLAAALAASERELAITQQLEKAYPDNVGILMDASISYDHNYRDNFALGRLEAARDMVRKAFDMRLPLVDADPGNYRNISLLVRTTRRLGGVYQKLNQTAEALQAYEAGLARITAYVQRSQDHSMDKDIAAIQAELDRCRQKRGRQ